LLDLLVTHPAFARVATFSIPTFPFSTNIRNTFVNVNTLATLVVEPFWTLASVTTDQVFTNASDWTINRFTLINVFAGRGNSVSKTVRKSIVTLANEATLVVNALTYRGVTRIRV
jgi:hypothetical protein